MARTTEFEGFYYLKSTKAGRGGTGFDDEDEEDSGFFLSWGQQNSGRSIGDGHKDSEGSCGMKSF